MIEQSNDNSRNFIQNIIDQDLREGLNDGRVHTRFPPEPNGYLHIGHALSIMLNYGLAERNNGLFNVRFDDTNPTKEEEEFVQSIIEDVKWLGANWGDRPFFASDYFDYFYEFAVQLIEKGLAYVCDLSQDEIREYRGTLTTPGKDSPYRSRSIEENLSLFQRMKNGEFPNGSRTLRAKIDMSSPNLNMRDPVLYRILHATHHRTGDKWCIYPMYDYAHPLEDALENITHSVCTLEYADHRPLYDWVLDNVDLSSVPGIKGRPKQIEFARLNLTHTVMSKRKLRRLVEEGYVDGWDDPRMPTIAGLRRRGYTPESIRSFCDQVGVARSNSIESLSFLEHCVRENLNKSAIRVMAVLRPVKLILTNYPEDQVEWVEIENNPEEPETGTRQVPFCRELYIEKEDFMENPPKKFYRLSPGQEVRLKGAYIVKCQDVVKDSTGQIVEIHCTYDPDSKSGSSGGKRRVKATLHWVSARHGIPATVRLYDKLFLTENPDDGPEGHDFTDDINPKSLEVLNDCVLEPSISEADPDIRYQFLRQGYFCVDPVDYRKGKIVFNRIVTLRDTWAKIKAGSTKS
jgi:glutaminyl-tRNA synthetase